MTSEPDPIAAVSAAMSRRSTGPGRPRRAGSSWDLPAHHRRGRHRGRGGTFEDPEWVEAWDVAFADLYLAALDADLPGRPVPRPWRLAFDAPAACPPLRHVLLGINAHVNYDLPQALLAVISRRRLRRPGADGPAAARPRAHRRRPRPRVAAEDASWPRSARTLLDRVLSPLNRLGVQAVPARGAAEGVAQHGRAAARAARRPRGVRRAAGGAGGAQRRADRRPARARPGAAAAGRRGFGVVLPSGRRTRSYTTRSSGGRRWSSGPSSR